MQAKDIMARLPRSESAKENAKKKAQSTPDPMTLDLADEVGWPLVRTRPITRPIQRNRLPEFIGAEDNMNIEVKPK